MGLYNFQPRFVDAILAGTKTHTIRAARAHPDKPGSTMHLYTGLRHKGARLLGRWPCVKVEEIHIEPWNTADDKARVWIDYEELDLDEKQALARRDGFADFPEMVRFWKGRLPFDGHIIHWKRPDHG